MSKISAYRIRGQKSENVSDVIFSIMECGDTFRGSVSNVQGGGWSYHNERGQFMKVYSTISEFIDDTGYAYQELKQD